MAKIRSLAQIFAWFKTGSEPTQSQFEDTFSSFFHKEEDTIPMHSIERLDETLKNKYDKTDGLELENRVTGTEEAIQDHRNRFDEVYDRLEESEDRLDVHDGDIIRLGEEIVAGDANTLSAAKGYTDERETAITAYVDVKDAETLQAGKDYVDTREVAILKAADSKDVTVLKNAKAYTDVRESEIMTSVANKDAETLQAAKQHTAERETAILSAADSKDATVLANAKNYTDTRETAIQASVDIKDANMLRSAKEYADAIVAALVDNSPEALNTLNELAAALGNDPNFATTVMAAIGNKVDKVSGKGLSTNDYTNADRIKLAGIAAEANNYVHPDNASTRHVTDTEKATWNAKETPAAAQQKADAALSAAKTYAQTIVSNLADDAPEALNTLKELAAAIGNDPSFATTVMAAIGSKVDKISGKGLSTNDYTSADKTKLSGIATGAQVNVLEGVKVNGAVIPVTGKTASIDLSGYALDSGKSVIYGGSKGGWLVKTKIQAPKSTTEGPNAMCVVNITGNNYGTGQPIDSVLQFYSYRSNNIPAPRILHNGSPLGDVKIFYYNNLVYIWIPTPSTSSSIVVSGKATLAVAPNDKYVGKEIIDSITSAAMPEVEYSVTAVVFKYSAGSGISISDTGVISSSEGSGPGFGGSGGDAGTAATAARYDHKHDSRYIFAESMTSSVDTKNPNIKYARLRPDHHNGNQFAVFYNQGGPTDPAIPYSKIGLAIAQANVVSETNLVFWNPKNDHINGPRTGFINYNNGASSGKQVFSFKKDIYNEDLVDVEAANFKGKLIGDADTVGTRSVVANPVIPEANKIPFLDSDKRLWASAFISTSAPSDSNVDLLAYKTAGDSAIRFTTAAKVRSQVTDNYYHPKLSYTPADDSAVVKLTGNQAMAGTKTFSSIPILPGSNPTSDNQAARKGYVDAKTMVKSLYIDNDTNGFLVKTSVSATSGRMVAVNITGNSYTQDSPVNSTLQFYGLNTGITNAKVTHFGSVLSDITVFLGSDNYLYFFIAPPIKYRTLMFTGGVRNFSEDIIDTVTSASAIPAGATFNTSAVVIYPNVRISGNQTITGTKTFSTIPVLPASNPTSDNQAARKAYVDTTVNSAVSTKANNADVVKLTGNQTVAGVKTFSSSPVVPTAATSTNTTAAASTAFVRNAISSYAQGASIGTITAANSAITSNESIQASFGKAQGQINAKANNADVVKVTGDQTIAGIKTFSAIPVLPASNPTSSNQAVRKAYVDGLKLASPKALTFTGAATGTYDGSTAVTINIPSGGSSRQYVSFAANVSSDMPKLQANTTYFMSSGNATVITPEYDSNNIPPMGSESEIILPYTCTLNLSGSSVFMRHPSCDSPNPSRGYVIYTAKIAGTYPYIFWNKGHYSN